MRNQNTSHFTKHFTKTSIALAAIALLALGCNKKTQNQAPAPTPTPASQGNQQSTDQTAPGKPNGQTQTNLNPTGPDYNPGNDANSAESAPQPEVLEVDMSAAGFSPASITINKGDYIWFVNKDSQLHWPVSDKSGFDAGAGVATGKRFQFQFNSTGTWGYHDKLNSALTGTVIVQ